MKNSKTTKADWTINCHGCGKPTHCSELWYKAVPPDTDHWCWYCAPEGSVKVTRDHSNYVLCEGRHEVVSNDGEAVTNAIFTEIADPTDVVGIQDHAEAMLSKHHKDDVINVYVTGLSVALVAVINVSLFQGLTVVLWHYDKNKGEYYAQRIGDAS